MVAQHAAPGHRMAGGEAAGGSGARTFELEKALRAGRIDGVVSKHGWFQRLKHEFLLVLFTVLTVVLACVDPQPWSRYQGWLQWPTLCGLLGLMISIQGIRDSGLVQRAAGMLVAHMHSLRGVGLLL